MDRETFSSIDFEFSYAFRGVKGYDPDFISSYFIDTVLCLIVG